MVLNLILVHFFNFQILIRGKNTIIFGVSNTSSMHIDNKKNILVLGKDPTQGLDDFAITATVEYSMYCSRSKRKFYLSLHYNGSKRFLFVNVTKIYQFKAKDSETKPNPLYLGNIAKDLKSIT